MKKFLNICIALFVLMFMIITVTIIKKQSLQISKLEQESAWTEQRISILRNNFIEIWKTDKIGLFMDDIYDEDGHKVDIEYFRNMSPILIFKFSKINCMDCVVKQIDVIKEFTQFEGVNTIMICDYDNKRELGVFKRTNSIKNQVYCCKTIFENDIKTPFICIFQNGVIYNVFFPEEIFPEMTEIYLKEMRMKYFYND